VHDAITIRDINPAIFTQPHPLSIQALQQHARESIGPLLSTTTELASRTWCALLQRSEEGAQNGSRSRRMRTGELVRLTDGQLVAMSLKGDTVAYGELVNRHQTAVNNLARTMIRDFQYAEDLAQETFLKAYSFLGDLQEPEKFGGWILTILRHTALDFLRAKKDAVSLETLQQDGFEPQQTVQDESQSAAIESHEEELRVMEALQSLRSDYREIIVLKHVERLSYKEIAERTNMTVSGVGEKLSRVRALLKQRLEKKRVKTAPAQEPAEAQV
jgi:RNA polymerase sigma-70 factor (ECF subfamily)